MRISQESAEQNKVLTWLRSRLPQSAHRKSLINEILELVADEPADDFGLFREEDAKSLARNKVESKMKSMTTATVEYMRDVLVNEDGAPVYITLCHIIDRMADEKWKMVYQGEAGMRVLLRFRTYNFIDGPGFLPERLKPNGIFAFLSNAARGIDLSRIGSEYQLADVLMRLVIREDMYLEPYLLDFIDGDMSLAELVLDYCESRNITPGRINMDALKSYVSTPASSLRAGSL